MKKLIKFFLICTLVLLALTVTASAATEGYYTYEVSSGEATITSVHENISGNITIPSTLGGYPVTTIDKYAFDYCYDLLSIVIPDSVTTIGERAFYNCDSLIHITIPYSVTTIGRGAFLNTYWFNNQPDGVVYAGKVLYDYKGTMPSNTKISVKEGTKGIADYAFYSDKNLTSIEIPDSLTTIGNYAFESCVGLTSIEIPDSLTTIGYHAFYDCTNLTRVYISDISAWCHIDFYDSSSNPVSLAETLFLNNELVTKLVIPDDVTEIKKYAFSDCKNLTNIVVGNSVTSIGDYAFSDCNSLTSIVIPDSVTTIGEKVLYGCSALEELTIPFIGSKRGNSGTADALFGYLFGTFTYAESYAAKQDYTSDNATTYYIPTKLNKVTITDEKVIPHGAFSNCSHISKIVIEGNPSAIMANSFTGFYNLLDVVVKAEKVKYVSSNIFEGSDFPTMYGYAGSTTETYANKYNVEFYTLEYSEEYTLSGNVKSVNNKIVVNVKVSDKVRGKHLHIALYDAVGKQIDYMIVPTYSPFDEINVVFTDNKSAKNAKMFLWESLTSLTPISSSVEIEIIR